MCSFHAIYPRLTGRHHRLCKWGKQISVPVNFMSLWCSANSYRRRFWMDEMNKWQSLQNLKLYYRFIYISSYNSMQCENENRNKWNKCWTMLACWTDLGDTLGLGWNCQYTAQVILVIQGFTTTLTLILCPMCPMSVTHDTYLHCDSLLFTTKINISLQTTQFSAFYWFQGFFQKFNVLSNRGVPSESELDCAAEWRCDSCLTQCQCYIAPQGPSRRTTRT